MAGIEKASPRISPLGKVKKKKKETEPGVIYLSRIPTGMNCAKIRQVFENYGEVGRIFLQPDEKVPGHKKTRLFTEGWVEFSNKKVAKFVALALNNQQVGGKKRARWYEELWNMKYLHRFKWGHLNERLAYERAVHMQRMRTEISQAKKESHFFIANVEKKERMRRLEKRQKAEVPVKREWTFKQRDTEEEILSEKEKKKLKTLERSQGSRVKKGKRQGSSNSEGSRPGSAKKAAMNEHFLKALFSGGVTQDDE